MFLVTFLLLYFKGRCIHNYYYKTQLNYATLHFVGCIHIYIYIVTVVEKIMNLLYMDLGGPSKKIIPLFLVQKRS